MADKFAHAVIASFTFADMDVDDEPPSMDGPVASGDHRTHHQQSESTLKSVAEGDEGVEDGGDAVDATLDETYLPSNDRFGPFSSLFRVLLWVPTHDCYCLYAVVQQTCTMKGSTWAAQ